MSLTSPPSSPSTSFTLFPELPKELRLAIWALASPPPREVYIRYNMKYLRLHDKTIWSSSEPNPTILHTCRESREEGLRSFNPSFGVDFHTTRIYFDPSRDTLVFGNKHIKAPSYYLLDVFLGDRYHTANDADKVQRMRLDVVASNYDRRAFIWDEIRQFTALKELTLFVWENPQHKVELMQHYHRTLLGISQVNPDWKVPKITVLLEGEISWGDLEPAERKG